MNNNMVQELSDISRTNQIKILDKPEDIAEKLFQYLFKMGKGIEYFALDFHTSDNNVPDNNSQTTFYQDRNKFIKHEVLKRLSASGQDRNYSDIQYFLSSANGTKYVFFLSSNTSHSGWQQLFNDNKESIFNLVFKVCILSRGLTAETINGFEELILLHSANLNQKESALLVWGQKLLVKYNSHDVLTLKLSRKSMRFLTKDPYATVDGDDLGDLLIYKNKNYYFDLNRDARSQNSIYFMDFSNNVDKFKKTQLYHYQNLMTKLEEFLSECEITFKALHFQASHYLEKPFLKEIGSTESLEIINNTGVDLNESDRQFLTIFFKQQGISTLTFFNLGKTINTYEQVESDGEEDYCWKITEIIPWSDVQLNRSKNYLVFNKELNEDVGSMAYQRNDGLWCPSNQIDDKSNIDFYSQLKNKYNFLDTGNFFVIQGINISQFHAVDDDRNNRSVFNYTANKVDRDLLCLDSESFADGKSLEVDELILCYLTQQEDLQEWGNFCNRHKIKISPEFQKILIELEIKNWISKTIVDSSIGLPIPSQSFIEKEFITIYVRSPEYKKAKAVAIEFIYKDGFVYIKDIIRDIDKIQKRFRFLRRSKNSEKLINDQQYFVDESEQLYISCYTSDVFTPILIGRNGILEDIQKPEFQINRKIGGGEDGLLPLVTHYNKNIKPMNRIKNMICLDLSNDMFVQYYVPQNQNVTAKVKKGFRAYHLIGKTYTQDAIHTSKLIDNPLTTLHFSTLTQNILKIGENSQSSLLQKIAQVLINN
jgi:hypothetical protein